MILTYSRWNSGRAVGPRTALTTEQLPQLTSVLEAADNRHDLALLATGVDTMLRASDLLQLRVRDVVGPDGLPSSINSAAGQITVRDTLIWRQRKTGTNVALVLTPFSQNALASWIEASGKEADHFLFTRTKPNAVAPIKPSTYRRVVKSWVRLIGLLPGDYSSHSIRRTKPVFMYRKGCPIADISKLLGHRSTEVTLHYLGITAEHLKAQALKYDVFGL